METLSSSFLKHNTPFLDSSLSTTPKNPKIKFTTNSSFSFHPVKKLITKRFAVKTSTERIVQERRKSSLHEIIFKPLNDLISSLFTDYSLPLFLDPREVLSGNFSPVDELPPTSCDVVEGSLPPCLDGAYIQNGPNPQFMPRGPYHLADGDGMLHSIKISQGKATFCGRFVRTYKYLLEHDLGYPVFPNVLAAFVDAKLTAYLATSIARVLTGQLKLFTNGFGTANTSLALFGGHLFALIESDLPYEVKITSDGDIITIDRHDFQNNKPFMSMTAHPKIDPETGEAFAFRNFAIPPFLTFFRIDSDGQKQKDVPILSMKHASFTHDFAVTKRFAIFPDTQIVVNPLEVFWGRSIMRVDLDKTPRLGILPRYAEEEREMYWVDVPGLNVLHVVNAWEEDGGDRIVIMATNLLGIEHALERTELTRSSMEKIVIDVKAKKVVERFPVSDRNLDFGVINPQYALKITRYIYAAELEGMPKMAGVVKLDLSQSPADRSGDYTVARRIYGLGCYGSEPIFVAREPNDPTAAEDDGYLLSYVYNENTKESKFLVMDAKSPSLEIVGAVKLPRRVPHGFHSIFVKASDLQKL